jgi:hypothetical protein
VFSKIDLVSGYYVIPIKKEDQEKTALVTPNGTYVFQVLSFGLKNAPAAFQSPMDRVLGSLHYQCAIAYLDDTIVYSVNHQNHIKHLELVLQSLASANLSINVEKSQFALTSISYLGFIVNEHGIKADPQKVKPILSIPAPSNLKKLERFLGCAGAYQKFLRNFQVVVEPLRRLKRMDIPFVWSKEQEKAFVLVVQVSINNRITIKKDDKS